MGVRTGVDAPTTRETATETLNDLLARAVEHVKAMTPEEREAMHERQKKAWVAAEMAIGDEGTRIVTGHRETADHAELARLAEAATPYWHAANLACGGNPIAVDLVAPFVGAMSPTVCFALLSEIAALRGEVEQLTDIYEATGRQCDGWIARAAQAERQRDEASWVIEKLLEANSRTSYPADHPIHAARRSAAAFLANQGADQ